MAVNVTLKSVFDDKGIRQAQSEFGKAGKTIGVAFAAVGATLAAAGTAAVRFGIDAAKGAEQAAIAQRRLDQIASSMGLFGTEAAKVSKRLGEFAEANELIIGVDADVIKATQAKLLTFKQLAETADIVGGAMDRATMAAVDLAAAGFGSAETNAIQLGKALNDPIKGITALARAGVTFTEQEKQKIRTLVESGNILEAQNTILSAIETQVGGTAEATASAFTRIELATNQVKDAIGEALLPVVEDFADELVILVPQLSEALAPAAQSVATIVSKELLPAIENFGKWLASPEGTQAVKDLTVAVVDSVKGFFDLAREVVKNWDAIKNAAVAIGTATIVITALKTAIQLVTTAQLLFNVAVKANPYVLAATALAALITGVVIAGTAMSDFAEKQKEAREESTGFTGRLAELAGEQKRLKELLDAGVISYSDYKKAIGPVNTELATLQGAMMRAAGAGRSLNDITLAKYRGQLGDTRIEAEKLLSAQRQLFLAMGGKITAAMTGPGVTGGGGGSGSSAAAAAADRKKEFNSILADTQKGLRDAKAQYNKAVSSARKTYWESVSSANADFNKSVEDATKRRDESLEAAARQNTQRAAEIQASFSQRLADIIQQSQDRLRDVYRSAVSTNIAELFGSDSVGKSVDKLVGSLRDKLAASRQLLQNAAALASAGFSQTFIEQVVAAGTTSGNELASSILQASPETQAELKSLYGALETESNSGMDALAKSIYDGAGLASEELKTLYATTVSEQSEALRLQAKSYAEAQLQISVEFDKALTDAATRRNETLAKAQKDLQDALASSFTDYKSTLDDIERDYKKRLADLGLLSGDLKNRAGIVQGQIDGAQGMISPIVNDIATTARATTLILPNATANATQPVININVATDPTKSAAQTGKAVAQVVQKYISTGGIGYNSPYAVI
jgi:hypothetical protein